MLNLLFPPILPYEFSNTKDIDNFDQDNNFHDISILNATPILNNVSTPALSLLSSSSSSDIENEVEGCVNNSMSGVGTVSSGDQNIPSDISSLYKFDKK